MRIGITGKRSTVTKAFLSLHQNADVVFGSADDLPFDCDTYLLCAGVLFGESSVDMSYDNAATTFDVNFFSVIRFCDTLFKINKEAKVCLLGSMSGVSGSYDMVYAGTKAALHLYAEQKHLDTAQQHLVCIAPTIIMDSGMTKRRQEADYNSVLRKGEQRRLGRWLTAMEVAKAAHFALSSPATCNTVINLTGGNW